jgi:hypothetical protein
MPPPRRQALALDITIGFLTSRLCCAGASRPLTRPPARKNRQQSGQGAQSSTPQNGKRAIAEPLDVTAAMQVSGQRPGGTSGAYNRSLCRSAPVLSHYPDAGTARLTDVPDIPADRSVLAVLSCLAARCRIGPRHPIEAATEALAECPSLPLGCTSIGRVGGASIITTKIALVAVGPVPGHSEMVRGFGWVALLAQRHLRGGGDSGRTDAPGLRLLAPGDGRGLASAVVHHGALPGQDPWPGSSHQAPAESCDTWRCERHERGRS